MKITNITAGRSRTHNLGEYNSVRVWIELTASLEDGDDEQLAIEDLQSQCLVAVRNDSGPFLRHIVLPLPASDEVRARTGQVQKANVQRLFMGREVLTDEE